MEKELSLCYAYNLLVLSNFYLGLVKVCEWWWFQLHMVSRDFWEVGSEFFWRFHSHSRSSVALAFILSSYYKHLLPKISGVCMNVGMPRLSEIFPGCFGSVSIYVWHLYVCCFFFFFSFVKACKFRLYKLGLQVCVRWRGHMKGRTMGIGMDRRWWREQVFHLLARFDRRKKII